MLPVLKKATFSKKLVFSSLALMMASALSPAMAQDVTCPNTQNQSATSITGPVIVSGSGALTNTCLGSSSETFTITASSGNGIALGENADISSVKLSGSGSSSPSTITASSGYGLFISLPKTGLVEEENNQETTPSTPSKTLSELTLSNLTISAGLGGVYTDFTITGKASISGSTISTTSGAAVALYKGANSVEVSGSNLTSTTGNGLTLSGTFGPTTNEQEEEATQLSGTTTPVIQVTGSSKISASSSNGYGIFLGGVTTVKGDIKIDSGATVTGQYGVMVSSNSTVSGNLVVLGKSSAIYNAGTITGNISTSDITAENTVPATGTPGTVAGFTNVGTVTGNVTLHFGQVSENTQPNDKTTTPNLFNNAQTISGKVSLTGLTSGDRFINSGSITGPISLDGTLGQTVTTESDTVTADITNTGSIADTFEVKTSGDGLFFNDVKGTLTKGLTYSGSGSLALINSGTIGVKQASENTPDVALEGQDTNSPILKLTAGSGYTTVLSNQSGAHIYGDVEIAGAFKTEKDVANIQNAGTIDGNLVVKSSGTGLIANTGTITGSISTDSTIRTTTGLTLANAGTITGNVTLTGDGQTKSLLNNATGGKLTTVSVGGSFHTGGAQRARVSVGIYNDGSISNSLTVTATGVDTLLNDTNGYIQSLTIGSGSSASTLLSILNNGQIDEVKFGEGVTAMVPSIVNSGTLGAASNPSTEARSASTLTVTALSNTGTVDVGDLTVTKLFDNEGTLKGNVTVSGDTSGAMVLNTQTLDGNLTVTGQVNAITSDTTKSTRPVITNAGSITGALTLTTTNDVSVENLGSIGQVALYSSEGTSHRFSNLGEVTGDVLVNTTQAPTDTFAVKSRQATRATEPASITNAGQIGGTLTVGGTDASIQNSGAIGQGIVFTGSGTVDIAVTGQGSVGDNATGSQLVISTAGAKANIDSWNTSLTKDSNGQTVLTPIKASGSGSIASVGTVTITDLGSGNLNAPIDTTNLVSGLSFEGKASSVQFSADLSGTGSLEGIYDPETGKLTPVYKADQSSAGVLSRTYAAQMMRRSVFLQGVLAEENFSSLVAGQNFTARQVYVKPYATTGRYDFSGLTTDNDTTGIMLGGNWSNGKSALTMALGYESGDASNDRYDTTLDTYYLTINGLTHLMRWANADVFGQLNVTASRTTIDLTNYQTATVATGSTNAASVEGSALLGLQYAINSQSYLMPTVGLGFVSANVSDYAMAGSAIADRYNPGEINLGYAALALNWKQLWTPRLETSLAGGVRVNFNTDFDVDATYGDSNLTGQYSLSRSWEYINATVTGHLAYNQDVSLSYLGVFDSTGSSHSAVVKWGYNF